MKQKITALLLAVLMVISTVTILPLSVSARNCESVTIADAAAWDDGSLKSMNVTFDWGAAGNEHLYIVVLDEHGESNSDGDEYWFQYDCYSHTDVDSIEKSIADFAAYREINWYAYGGDGSTPVSGSNTIEVTFEQGKVPLNVDRNYSFVMFNAPDGSDYRPTDPLGTLKCASSALSFENTSGQSTGVEVEGPDSATYTVTNGTPESDAEKNHGYITVDKETAEEGDTVTVTVSPAEGYRLKKLSYAITPKTIADILPDGFPTAETDASGAPGSAWKTAAFYQLCYVSYDSSNLCFFNDDEEKSFAVNTDAVVPLNEDGNYVYKNGTVTVTFSMAGENGTLNLITFANTADTTWNGTYQESACVAAGTMITMYDGTQKKVEDLKIGDVIRTFDHEKGEVSSAPVCFIWESKNAANAFTLTFEGDISVTVIEEHGFYDSEENKYVFINALNAKDCIGHHFYNADTEGYAALEDVEILHGCVDAYAIATSRHLNHLSNGMLSVCDGTFAKISNLFEYDSQMKYDADLKKKDIEDYGLTSLEKVLEYKGFNEADYYDYNLQYLDVALGKGLISHRWIEELSDYCEANGIYDSLPVTGTEASKTVLMSAAVLKNMLGSAPESADSAEIKADKEGQYVFTMPAYAVTVTAEFEEIPHTHNIVKVDGQASTEDAAGWKDYYECKDSEDACRKYFEDENGASPIEDLEAWKSEDGNGYIAPLVHKPELADEGRDATEDEAGYKAYFVCNNCGRFFEDAEGLTEIPDIEAWKSEGGSGYIAPLKTHQTGDESNTALWIVLTALSSMGICACFAYEKKKKNEQ